MNEYESVHHEVLHRLVAGAAGSTTAELNELYEAVAPVAYNGTTKTAIQSRRYRRQVLSDLEAEDCVSAHDTPRGRVWVTRRLPDDLDVQNIAKEARHAQQTGTEVE